MGRPRAERRPSQDQGAGSEHVQGAGVLGYIPGLAVAKVLPLSSHRPLLSPVWNLATGPLGGLQRGV